MEVFESQKEDAEYRQTQYEFLIAEAAEIGNEAKSQELKDINSELVNVIAKKNELYADARDYFKFTNAGDGKLVSGSVFGSVKLKSNGKRFRR